MILKALARAYRNAPDDAGWKILQVNRHALGTPAALLMLQQQHCPTSSQQGIQIYPVQLR
jgi:hypothetical protein